MFLKLCVFPNGGCDYVNLSGCDGRERWFYFEQTKQRGVSFPFPTRRTTTPETQWKIISEKIQYWEKFLPREWRTNQSSNRLFNEIEFDSFKNQYIIKLRNKGFVVVVVGIGGGGDHTF